MTGAPLVYIPCKFLPSISRCEIFAASKLLSTCSLGSGKRVQEGLGPRFYRQQSRVLNVAMMFAGIAHLRPNSSRALIARPGSVRRPFLQLSRPSARSPVMAARVQSCTDSGLVDGSLSRSTSDFSSDSMQTSTPSSSNGSVLQMAERRDSSQQQVRCDALYVCVSFRSISVGYGLRALLLGL